MVGRYCELLAKALLPILDEWLQGFEKNLCTEAHPVPKNPQVHFKIEH